MKTPARILHSSFSEDFIQKMRNRIVTSHHKYGELTKAKRDLTKPRDEVVNATYRINKYVNTGNLEYLIDAANFLMFEYMEMNGKFIPVDNEPSDKII